MRWQRISLITALVLTVLAVVAIVLLQSYDFNRFKPLISEAVQDATGRLLFIDGDITVDLGIHPGISIQKIRFQNAAWGTRPEMLLAEELAIHISLPSLIFGPMKIHDIVLRHFDIFLENGPSGEFNLALDTPGAPTGSTSKGTIPDLRIQQVLVEQGRIAYLSDRMDNSTVMAIDRIKVGASEDLSSARVDINVKYDRYPVRISGSLARPLEVISTGEPLHMALNVEALQSTAVLECQIKDPKAVSGIRLNVEITGRGTRDLLDLIGASDVADFGPFRMTADIDGDLNQVRIDRFDFSLGEPELVNLQLAGSVGDLAALQEVDLTASAEGEDLGRILRALEQPLLFAGPFKFTARCLETGTHQYRLDKMSINVGKNDLNIEADIDVSGSKPNVVIKADSKLIDLRPLFETSKEEQAAVEQSKGRRKQTTGGALTSTLSDLLTAADVDLKMETGSILLPDLTLSELNTVAVLQQGQISVRVDGNRVPDLEALTTLTHMPELGPFQANCRIKPLGDSLALTDLRFKAGSTDRAEVVATGGINNLLTGRGFELVFRLQGDDAAKLGRFIVEPWPLQGPYRLNGRMNIADYTALGFDDLVGTIAGMPFEGAVTVDLTSRFPRVRIAATSPRLNLQPLSLPHLALPEDLRKEPDLGPLQTKINIVVPDGPVGFDEVDITAGGTEMVLVQVTGRVTDIANLRGMHLKLVARGNDLSRLAPLLNTSIPLTDAFELHIGLKDPQPGSYDFNQIAVTVGSSTASANARYDINPSQPKLTVAIEADSIDLTPFFAEPSKQGADASYFSHTVIEDRLILPSWPHPPKGVVATDAEITLSVKSLVGNNFSVTDLQSRIEKIRGNFTLDATGQLMTDAPIGPDTADPLQIGRIDANLQGVVDPKRLVFKTFRLHGGDPQMVALNVEGNIRHPITQQGLDVRLQITGDDAGFLNRFWSTKTPLTGPYQASVHLTDPKLKQYQIDELQLSIGGSDLTGKVDIDLSTDRPSFAADLTSQRLDLRPFFLDGQPVVDQPTEQNKGKAKVFSSQPIPLEWLDSLNARLSLESRKLLFPFASVDAFKIGLVNEDGNLTVKPVSFTSGETAVEGQLAVLSKTDGHRAQLLLAVDHYDIGKELADMKLKRDIEGLLNAKIDVKGPAESVAAFMGGLDGKITVTINDGRVKKGLIDLAYVDLTSTLLKLIQPFGSKSGFVDLNCFLTSFQIQNGRADQALIMDTPDTTLISAGTIDLKSERINLTLKSSPKGGLSVRGLGRIGVSLNEFTKPFKLSGTLAHPSLAVDPTQTAFAFGKVLGGLALGPYGIALLFADVSLEKESPCVKVLLEANEESRETGAQ